jgi:hypothetical protein
MNIHTGTGKELPGEMSEPERFFRNPTPTLFEFVSQKREYSSEHSLSLYSS